MTLVKPCSVGLVLGWVTKYEYPCCNNFFLFPPSLSKAILKPTELQHCVTSFLLTCSYHQFVRYFGLSVFTCTCLQCHCRNVDFEYLSLNTGLRCFARQYSNKNESSNYNANGDLAIKSVSSAI